MDNPAVLRDFFPPSTQPINTVEMHTTGEPTRIVYSGFPKLQGLTLLEKMEDAKSNYDHIRARLMLEPRGHREMYGALLVYETELTVKGEANIGVLFMHNGGWSTMCGHATIGLGRFLVDFATQIFSSDLLPKCRLHLDEEKMTTTIKLHCPCGVVDIAVPVTQGPQGNLKSDFERAVSFISVDSYASGIDIEIILPTSYRWPELGEKTSVVVDFCWGGAFYCVISARELGFVEGLNILDIEALSRATGMLKAAIIANPQLGSFFQHTQHADLGYLYGVIVTDDQQGKAIDGAAGAETGLCIFAAQQVDRSPCGSGCAARRALAHAKRLMPPENRWTYHSLVSNAHNGQGGFTAQVVGDATADKVRIQVEGCAFYTGFSTFLVEESDIISSAGFLL